MIIIIFLVKGQSKSFLNALIATDDESVIRELLRLFMCKLMRFCYTAFNSPKFNRFINCTF
jgi:hypothetical protein